jgi:hypothetical protein
MYALMIVFLSLVIVGATTTLRKSSEVSELAATEHVVAGNFIRYAQGVRCYAKANPSFMGASPPSSVLKATSYQGVSCLNPAYNPIGGTSSGNQVVVPVYATPAAPVCGRKVCDEEAVGQAYGQDVVYTPPPVLQNDGDFRGWVTADEILIYQVSSKSLRNMPVPISALYQSAGSRYARVGMLGANGYSIVSPGGGVVGQIPESLRQTEGSVRPTVGAPVQVFNRN